MSIIFPRYADHAASLAAIVSDLQTLLVDLSEFEKVCPACTGVSENVLEAVTKIQDVEDLLFTAAETLSDEGL